MGNLDNIFEKRLKQLGLKKQVDAAMVVQEAQNRLVEIFGPDVDKNLRVISFNKGVLKIAARTSAWANECQGCMGQLVVSPIQRIVFSSEFNLDRQNN